ncbi:MAG: 2Fe-2S iron-sulfur cluster binding domain-containing protein, partial [bacterium]|nr:2Fe-2S iron-sulfur cluster binding domain-containing protein [bacterium]
MKPTLSFILIHQTVETDLPPGTVTLGFIREYLGLKGTKEGCGEGECGACTVLLGQTKDDTMTYRAVASCLLPIGELAGKHVITVEGLNNDTLNPIQHALVDEGAIQCGFCTPGFVLALTGFFLNSPNLEYQDAIDAMDGNICRCTGYVSIRKAAQNLCNTYSPKLDTTRSRLEQLVEWTVLPDYFSGVPERLQTLTQ